MRYRVTFMERTNVAGEPSETPHDNLAINVPDGVIVDSTFVERTMPEAVHNEELLEEDDNFLSVGSETWEYEVNGSREDEFLAAVKSSRLAAECLRLDNGLDDAENGVNGSHE